MFKKIIWATDGSDLADEALPYAKALAAEDGASLVVVHVIQVYTSALSAGLPLYADDEERKAKVERQVAELQDEGLDVTARIITTHDQPGHAISDVAKEVGADVIVASTRGHTTLGGLFVGSVTQRLLHVAPCPVLAVRPAAE